MPKSIASGELQQLLEQSLGDYSIPFDLSVIAPPKNLKSRIRPYSMLLPQQGDHERTLGYKELAGFKAILVMVLFTDVAVDYYIRRDLAPAVRKKIALQYGEHAVGTDFYVAARKELAVWAGLGRIARNSLFFSRRFGLNCKIELVFLNIPVVDVRQADHAPEPWRLGACLQCHECVSACPVSAYDDFVMSRPLSCEKHITPDWYTPERMCRACIESCPASNQILKKLHSVNPHHYSIYDSARRNHEMFVVTKAFELAKQHDAISLQADDTDISFDLLFYELLQFIQHYSNPFSLTHLSKIDPALSISAIYHLMGILEECQLISALQDVQSDRYL